MPKRKRSSTTKRRAKRRRRRRRRSRAFARKPRGIFAKRNMQVLRYVEHNSLNPGIGGTNGAHDTYTLNDVHDPYFGLGGHQPMGFDQMMLLYNHFTVVGAKISCSFTSTDVGSSSRADEQYIITLEISGNQVPINDVEQFIESKKGSWARLTSPYSKATKTLTRKVSIKKELGITDLLDDDRCRGNETIGPTEKLFAHIGAYTMDPTSGTLNPTTVPVQVIIDYMVIFTEPKTLAQS